MAVIVDIIEIQDDIVFITGYVNDDLAVGDTLNVLQVLQPAKKKKHSPQIVSKTAVSLTIATIIVTGEPVNRLPKDQLAQIGLDGDADTLINLIQSHHWHERNGRYHLPRNETRLIMLSGD